jgi:hypothetical protein
MLPAITEAGAIYKGDFATAEFHLQTLVTLGAITVERTEEETIYRKAAKWTDPEPLTPDDYVARENAEIQRHIAEDRKRIEREYETWDKAKAFLDQPLHAERLRSFNEGAAAFGLEVQLAALSARLDRIEVKLGLDTEQ